MTIKLINQSITDFIESVSTGSAVPGGGSVAAAAGAFGAGLISMSCNLTVGNDNYKSQWDEFTNILVDVESYRRELLELVDKDYQVYNGIVNIRKAKDTLIQKIGEYEYKDRLQTAYKHAAEIPLKTAGLSLKSLRYSKIVAEKGNVNTISDTGVGAQLCYAGVVGGLFNVKINLKSITDETYKLNMENIVSEIEDVSLSLVKITMLTVEKKL
jgi:formiminotetrahydrofolate cyclodeaminase